MISLGRKGKFSLSVTNRLKEYIVRHHIKKIVCVNLYPMLYAAIITWLTRKNSVSFISLINTTEFYSAKERFSMYLYSIIIKYSERIIFGCQAQQECWIKRYKLERNICDYIYNGVDENWYSLRLIQNDSEGIRAQSGLDSRDFIIGSVGQLRPEKGHKNLILALQRLVKNYNNVKVIIIGGGPMRKKLEQHATGKNLTGKVLFVGEVHDIRPYLAIMDVYVLPSIAVETFSNAALEAMAMERPVILSDIGGASEMIKNGKSGYLYKKDDIDELCKHIINIMEDPARGEELGKEAREEIKTKFTFSKMIDKYEALLCDNP